MTDLSLFIERVAASGLMTAAALKDRLRPIEPTRPDAVDQAARLLIETGDLTPFQVKKLRTGLTKGFFLGRWRLMRPLASGGSSRVMLARDEREGGFVALKVVPPAPRSIARDLTTITARPSWLAFDASWRWLDG